MPTNTVAEAKFKVIREIIDSYIEDDVFIGLIEAMRDNNLEKD